MDAISAAVAEGKNAVLVAAEDRAAIEETLFLEDNSGMADSFRTGMAAPLADCVPEALLEW